MGVTGEGWGCGVLGMLDGIMMAMCIACLGLFLLIAFAVDTSGYDLVYIGSLFVPSISISAWLGMCRTRSRLHLLRQVDRDHEPRLLRRHSSPRWLVMSAQREYMKRWLCFAVEGRSIVLVDAGHRLHLHLD